MAALWRMADSREGVRGERDRLITEQLGERIDFHRFPGGAPPPEPGAGHG